MRPRRHHILLLVAAAMLAGAVRMQAQQHDHESLGALDNESFVRVLEHRREMRIDPKGDAAAGLPSKCGLHYTLESIRRSESLSADQRLRMERALAPTLMQTSIVSASGRFRVHFDTTGTHTPALLSNGVRVPGTARQYATEVARFFDESYEIEVVQRGFLAPPFAMGRSEYDIYIKEYARSDYGQTFQIERVSNTAVMPCYSTYIQLDNDFLGYPTSGLDGARVTAAHEFHHMVQMGNYGVWSNDLFMYEMTSTYFEDVVYNDVNDYLIYLAPFFQMPERAMSAWRGYELVLWPKMLEQRYGAGIVRAFWDQIRERAPLAAMDAVLRSPAYQTDMASEYCRFMRWNWYTADRTSKGSTAERYPEAATYPRMRTSLDVQLVSDVATLQGAVLPLAAQYGMVRRGADTAVFAVANTDILAAINKLSATTGFSLEVRAGQQGDFTPLDNGWSYRFTPGNANTLCHTAFAATAVSDVASGPYPNPYDPARDGILRIPIPASAQQTRTSLAIHSLAMDLQYSISNLEIRVDDALGRFVTWDGTGSDGTYVASGVYIYAIDLGGEIRIGKIAVVRR